MPDSGPKGNAPIGASCNQFKIDLGTLALTKTPIPGPFGLECDPWPEINLRLYGSDIKAAENRFAQLFRKELLGVTAATLAKYGKYFSGTNGTKFKQRVIDAANKVNVSPGLLAAVCVFEQGSSVFWTRSSGEGDTYSAGADHYYARRYQIRREAPAAASIKILRTKNEKNERDNPVTTAYIPASQLVLVIACYLKERISVVKQIYNSEGGNFDMLPDYLQFFLSRLIFNPGTVSLRHRSRQILSGKSLLVSEGKRGPSKPRRGATVCAAVAMYFNETIFSRN